MPLSAEGERVLRAMFAIGRDRSLSIGKRVRAPTPGPAELFELCELLATEPREELLQQFLERNVGFLTGLVGTRDNTDLAILFKPPIGTQFRADFCILQSDQGGSAAHLFEIETSHDELFIQNGAPSKRLSYAIKQTEDWRIWIDQNAIHYAKELIRMAKSLPLIGEHDSGSPGVRFYEPDRLEQVWNMFGGGGCPHFTYTILVGRWSALSDSEKERLISRNRHGGHFQRVFTYEQVGRLANFRLEREYWDSNETVNWTRPVPLPGATNS
jgi:Shedu protein SduA, C-terminal